MPDHISPYDDYPALMPKERKERENELTRSSSPEEALRARQARSWAALFDSAREGELPERAIIRSYLFDEEPPDEADPEALHILEELQRDADPVGLFERLRNPDANVEAPSGQQEGALKTKRRTWTTPFTGWGAQSVAWGRYAFSAFLVAAVAYAGLFAVSRSTLPEHTQIAALSDVSDSFRPPRVRGPESESPADEYEAAVDRLDDARTSILGLFPSYDTEELDEAAGAFQAIREQAEPQTAYRQEATLALARIRIEQQRFDEATRLLDELGASGGYRAPDAERLLDLVEATSQQ